MSSLSIVFTYDVGTAVFAAEGGTLAQWSPVSALVASAFGPICD